MSGEMSREMRGVGGEGERRGGVRGCQEAGAAPLRMAPGCQVAPAPRRLYGLWWEEGRIGPRECRGFGQDR